MLKIIEDKYFDINKSSVIVFFAIIFIIPAAILMVGDFDRQLMIQDSSTSGVFSSYLILFNDEFSNDILQNITKLGYLSPSVLIQNFLFSFFGISLELTSYILTIIGGLFFCFCMFFLSRAYEINNHNSLLVSYMAIAFVMLDINLAKFGPPGSVLQAFPDMNFYAFGVVCLIFASLIKGNNMKANILLFCLVFVHIGHAFLILPIIGLFSLYKIFKNNSYNKNYIFNILYLLFIFALIFLISVMAKSPGDSIPNEYLWKIIIGLKGGHTFGWENNVFIGILSQYFVSFFLLLIAVTSIKNDNIFNKKLYLKFSEIFFLVLFIIIIYIIIDIILLNFPIYELLPFVQIHPLRATSYIQILIFPVIAFYLLNNILSDDSSRNLKITSMVFIIFAASFKSISLWIFLPFFIFFDKNLINKNYFYRNLAIFFLTFFSISLFITAKFLDQGSIINFVLKQSIFLIFDINNYINLPNFILFKLIAIYLILGLVYVNTKKNYLSTFKLSSYRGKHITIGLVLLSSIYLESINWFAGSVWFNKHEKPTLQVLHWMNQKSYPGDKFMTINRHMQMNGISKRPTFRPFPFFAEMYRANSIDVKFFSEDILNFWNINLGDTHGWFEEHQSDIYLKYNNLSEKEVIFLRDKFQFDYMITSSKAKNLSFEKVYTNQDYIIYEVY